MWTMRRMRAPGAEYMTDKRPCSWKGLVTLSGAKRNEESLPGLKSVSSRSLS